jgi:hypothetical protein
LAERLHQTLAYIHNGVYQPGAQSRYFPDIDLQAVVARSLEVAYGRNTSAAIRDLRQWLG